MVEIMKLLQNDTYLNDLSQYQKLINWNKLRNRTVIFSGATGMIGRYMVDLIMKQNAETDLNCKIIALGRNENKAKKRFGNYFESPLFRFVKGDITKPLQIDNVDKDAYVIHGASTTHPRAYSTYPISTVLSNIEGTRNLLNLSKKIKAKRFCLLSSVEIYGENRGDVAKFNEDYCGYINCNTLRAGYPEAKRVSEALCQAYMKEENLEVSIVRLARSYGPTMLMSDSKALSQFIKNGLNEENIVLKSKGTQYFSYVYVGDAVYGILQCLTNGVNGEAYNIADDQSNIHLKDLAQKIAELSDVKVVFDLPDEQEVQGYSKASQALLTTDKAREIGFKSQRNIDDGLKITLDILK